MDYQLELEKTKKWAEELLIVQYSQSNKNKRLIDAIVELLFANLLILQIRDLCLNVEESIGAQLDVVGRWVGIDRYFNGIDLWEGQYHAHPTYKRIRENDYTDNQGGFSNYTNFTEPGKYLMYKDYQDTRTKVNAIGDNLFRQLIKLKIIKNSIIFSNKNIDDAIYSWSNGQIYTTWDVMKITYHYPKSLSNLMKLATYKDILLAPTGCIIELMEYNNG